MDATVAQSLSRLAIVSAVCVVAAWGFQLLPPDDYQPSRPLYALGWLLGSVLTFVMARKKTLPRSAARMLIVIFAGLFVITLLM